MIKHAKILATGSYLPEKILTNHDLEKIVDTSDEWIKTRTGIEKRHIAAEDQNTSDLAYHASISALHAANIAPEQIDLIIVATTTPDLVFPSTACLLQSRLGIKTCAAFDLQAVCSGFIYGLHVARQFIETGSAKTVLLVGAEIFSRIIDWEDRNTCILFGDGAGAVLLTNSDTPGILASSIHADGSQYKKLYTPLSQTGMRGYVRMSGKEIYADAVKIFGQVTSDLLINNETNSFQKLDWFIPHQANIRIIKAVAKRIKLPMEKVALSIEQHANLSAASIPLVLDLFVRQGKIQPGHRLLMAAFGGGYTWGGCYLEF